MVQESDKFDLTTSATFALPNYFNYYKGFQKLLLKLRTTTVQRKLYGGPFHNSKKTHK